MRRPAAFALAAGLLVAGRPATAEPAIVAPLPNGVVDFGDELAFALAGPGCEDASVRVEVTTGAQTIDGPTSTGCAGVATVPSEAAVQATGWHDGDPIAVDLASGSSRIPLRLMRIELEHGTPAAGNPSVVPADDMRGGGHAMRMATGDVVALGRADLMRINSVSVRSTTTGSAIWELRVDAPDGPPVTRGALGRLSDGANYNYGWRDAWTMAAEEITARPPERAPQMFFAIVAAAPDVLVNHIDLNGTGIRAAHAVPPDPDGTKVLFDGSSFDGWSGSGFALRDGAMRGESRDGFTGSGSIVWTADEFTDVVLRMRVRAENFEDNGAILVPDEIQLRGSSEWFPGGYWTGIPCYGSQSTQIWEGLFGQDCGEPAERIKLNAFPDWSDLEIAIVGAQYRVTINGRVVTRHVRRAGPPAPFRLEIGNQPEYSFGLDYNGSNMLSGTGPAKTGGHMWFDDIRAYRCTSPADANCAM